MKYELRDRNETLGQQKIEYQLKMMIVLLIVCKMLLTSCTKLSLFVLNCLPLSSFVTVMLTRPLVVSTSLQTNVHALSIAFRNLDNSLIVACESSSLLIQISSLRRNNILLTSVIKFVLGLESHCSNNQIVS